MTIGGLPVQHLQALQTILLIMTTPIESLYIEFLSYTNSNGEELVGLALELDEDPCGGVRVSVLKDSNVVSCVWVVPLEERAVAKSQQCDYCE